MFEPIPERRAIEHGIRKPRLPRKAPRQFARQWTHMGGGLGFN